MQAADAQATVLDQEHLSRSLEEYARSKGAQHGEVSVSQALEGGAFNWKWSQTKEEVTLWVDVPAGTRPRAVSCDIGRNHLRLAVAGVDGVMEGALFGDVTGDSLWTIGTHVYTALPDGRTRLHRPLHGTRFVDNAACYGHRDRCAPQLIESTCRSSS